MENQVEYQIKGASAISFLFAIWLFISPYVMGFAALSTVALWTVKIAAIIVFALSVIRFFLPHDTSAMSWINVLVGLGLIASPFVWGWMGVTGILWDFLIVGVAFVVFNVWAAMGHLIRMRI